MIKTDGFDIENLRFGADGLIPAALTDADSGELLMLAYMNRDSLARTLETGLACFWSRSRSELWTKGETSGNYMHVREIYADCDRDALRVIVSPDGPACHTGAVSCFFEKIAETEESAPEKFSLDGLYALLEDRKANPKEGSYTNYLFEKGREKILKKVGEESTEVIIGGTLGSREETVYEIADLTYHILVLMVEMGIPLDVVRAELAGRHVIDKKIKQEKMK